MIAWGNLKEMVYYIIVSTLFLHSGFLHVNGQDYFLDDIDWSALLKAGIGGALIGVGNHLNG